MSEPEVSFVVYSYDTFRENAIGIPAPQANGPAYAERRYMNFDEVEGIESRHAKFLSAVWPIGRVDERSRPVTVCWGATEFPTVTDIPYGPALAFDGMPDTSKLDHQVDGRFVHFRIDYPDFYDIKLTGIDFDFDTTGTYD